MALKIWLPLNGNLNNQGLSNITVVNHDSTTVNNTGKIGKCYEFNGTSNYLSMETSFGNLDEFSFSFWAKASSLEHILQFKNDGQVMLQFSTTNSFQYRDTKHSSLTNITFTPITADTWTHYSFAYTKGSWFIYKNGILDTSNTATTGAQSIPITIINIGARTTTSGPSYYTGLIDDVRIYDHCLSAKEVKEISQGLVLHYKLNNSYSANLITNGFGELETENWSAPNRSSTTDLPENSTAKRSFYGSNSTLTLTPIEPNHSYTISCYVKAGSGATSTYAYPSIFPYDADGNFINEQNSRAGFRYPNTLTTLAQDLNPGDTVIYATDLSNWDASSGHYGNYCAIFNYVDKHGYVYPDMVYTRNIPAFASGTVAKTNLNKTENTITLLSAYSGPKRLAGTSICQSYGGGTYWYPFPTIKTADISDWTFKTRTFIPKNEGRLSVAKYIRWGIPTADIYVAENKLIDNTWYSEKIADSSGFNNDGIYYNITTNTNTARYNKVIALNGTNSYIKVTDNNWLTQGMEALTINLWAKSSAWTGSHIFSCTQTGGFNTEGGNSGYLRFPIHVYTNAAKTSYAYKYDSKELQISALSNTDWNMITWVYTTAGTKTYINGKLHHTYNNTSYGIHFNTNARLFFGCEADTANPTTPYFNGSFSDIRLYTTALSAEDILDLYHTSANIDNFGNLHTFELNETTTNLLRSEVIQKYKKNGFTVGVGEWVERNGEWAMNIKPKPFYQNYYGDGSVVTGILLDEIQPDTQYMINLWIDADNVYSSNNYRKAGLIVYYTDGTNSGDTLIAIGNANKPGFQHKQLLTDATKSISRIAVSYVADYNTYYRWDSYICPVDKEQITQTGITNTTQVITNNDIASFSHGGSILLSNIIEK